MKKLILSAAFIAIGTFAMAQQNSEISKKKDPARMEQRRADHLKKMQTDLNLSPAQVAKIDGLQKKRMEERMQQAPQRHAERKAKVEMWKAKRMKNEAEMKQILTPEQYQKWVSAKDSHKNKGKKEMKRQHFKKMQKAS